MLFISRLKRPYSCFPFHFLFPSFCHSVIYRVVSIVFGSKPFPQAPAGARRILVGWRRSDWLWCCGRSCLRCSRRMTKRTSPAGSGGWRPMREGYKVVALLLKPSLCLFGLVCRRLVLLPHPGSATSHLIASGDHHTLQHIQVHFGIEFQAVFEDVRWHDVALT